MITGKDFYEVLTALVPLYVAMILAFVAVRWGKIFTPDQCSGINRYVAVFAVPFLSFKFISSNNLYAMNFQFLAADCLQKLAVLAALLLWNAFSSGNHFEWVISLFSIITLPNTLVVGVPLLSAMYGDYSASLMVQIVVLQSIIWYTVLIALFEYRSAKIFISKQFPTTAGRIAAISVDPDVVSMSGREDLEADVAEVDDDGKVHVVVRRSMSSSFNKNYLIASLNHNSCSNATPRASNLSGADIYSIQTTPRGSSFGSVTMDPRGGYSVKMTSPRTSNLEEEAVEKKMNFVQKGCNGSISLGYPLPNQEFLGSGGGYNKELHMFSWSPARVSDVGAGNKVVPYTDPTMLTRLPEIVTPKGSVDLTERMSHGREMNNGDLKEKVAENGLTNGTQLDIEDGDHNKKNLNNNMPPLSVVTKLIIVMVWRKLIRNPNTYGCVLGLIWSLVSFRWNVKMPIIVEDSIKILSNTSLGMSMFGLGLFMALQPKIIACGKKMALMSIAGRFLAGSIVIAVTSVAVGLRGDLLRISIIQAALPQGIVAFVFAKEYNVHPELLSTGVIFGLLLTLPVTIIYYILLGL